MKGCSKGPMRNMHASCKQQVSNERLSYVTDDLCKHFTFVITEVVLSSAQKIYSADYRGCPLRLLRSLVPWPPKPLHHCISHIPLWTNATPNTVSAQERSQAACQLHGTGEETEATETSSSVGRHGSPIAGQLRETGTGEGQL